MAQTLSINAEPNREGTGTSASGICGFPGDQSTHVKMISITRNGVDVTSDYTITGPTVQANGSWSATIQPPVPNTAEYVITVTCTHNGQSYSSSLATAQAEVL